MTTHHNENADVTSETEEPSKSQRKKEMHELQQLGKQLAHLNEKTRLRLDLDPVLFTALQDYHRIKVPNALKRQMQFIGKLLQKSDVDGIIKKLDAIAHESQRKKQLGPVVDEWCKRLLEDDNDIQSFIDAFPQCDRQHLRNLIRTTRKKTNNPEALEKKRLFSYLNNIMSENLATQRPPLPEHK